LSARAAVTAFFALDGFVVASFYARLPALQDRLSLSNGDIGVALLALTLGLMVSQPLAGALASRRGSAPVMTLSGLAVCAAIVAPTFAGDLAGLALATAAIGVSTGALDVTMNMQGVSVERRLPRPILSGLHAAFSIGMLGGALVAGAAAGSGAAPREHLAGVALVAAAVTLVARRSLIADATEGPAFATPSRALAALGAIAFCVLLAEGATADWSAIHLNETLDASEGTAVAGLAAFSATMTLGRMFGDRITLRLGTLRHARGGALIAAAGAVLAAAAPSVPVAVAGFALTGIGLSALFPLMVRAAADRGGGPAIAAVSTAGYAGLVTGPPLVGFLAEATSLRLALGLVLGLLCLVAAALIQVQSMNVRSSAAWRSTRST
jgi:MFS family permease